MTAASGRAPDAHASAPPAWAGAIAWASPTAGISEGIWEASQIYRELARLGAIMCVIGSSLGMAVALHGTSVTQRLPTAGTRHRLQRVVSMVVATRLSLARTSTAPSCGQTRAAALACLVRCYMQGTPLAQPVAAP
jgi:hypothetical protein